MVVREFSEYGPPPRWRGMGSLDQRDNTTAPTVLRQNGDDGDDDDDGAEDVSLLENVQALVEKERALSNLKYEEAQSEAAAWRDRYMELQEALKGVALGDDSDLAQAPSHEPPEPEPELNINPSASVLQLSGRHLNSLDVSSLAEKMRWMKHLISVDLSHNDLTDECAGSLGGLFVAHMRSINLSHNQLGPLAASAVLEGLAHSKGLQRLALEGNLPLASATGVAVKMSEAMLRAAPSGLCCFSVTLNDFAGGPGGGGKKSGRPRAPLASQQLVKALGGKDRGTSASITSLGLPHARLHKATVGLICDRLLRYLVCLDIRDCFIGPSGASRLALALPSATLLHTLLLKGNAVGTVGGASLAHSLPKQQSLTHLDLCSNDLGDRAADALASSVAAGTMLKLLDIANNPVSGSAGLRLLNAAERRGVRLRVRYREMLNNFQQSAASESLAVEMDEISSMPASAAHDPSGFVELKRTILETDSLCTRVQWSSSCSAMEGVMRWRIGRRRSSADAVEPVREGISGIHEVDNQVSSELGWEESRVLARGWRKGDELSLWLAPCDRYGNPLLPSQRHRAGQLRCKNFRLYTGCEGATVWSDPVTLSDRDFEDGATVMECHPDLGSAREIVLMAGLPPVASACLPIVVRQIPIMRGGRFRAEFEARITSAGSMLSSRAKKLITRFAWSFSAGGELLAHGYPKTADPWSWSKISADVPHCRAGDVLALWLRVDAPPGTGAVIRGATKVTARSFTLFRVDVVQGCNEVLQSPEEEEQQVGLCYSGPHWMNAGSAPHMQWPL